MIRRMLCAALLLALAGCSAQKSSTSNSGNATPTPTAAAPAGFHIGVMTGTTSQGEEDFRAGQQVQAKYGARVKQVTYPDNFMQEQETVIAQMTGLAADPLMKVIVVAQAVPGSVAGARKIRESRPDILIGFIGPHEDPNIVDQASDIAVQPDQIARGVTIIDEAKQMGAVNFVHYSFPRHMSQILLSQRRDIMKQECEKQGMHFYFVTAPDPMGEGGLPAAQQFILEDVPREVQKYGKQTAFYTTNDGMQEPLIKSILQSGGYFVEQDVPAPTAGYPAALGMAIPPDKAGDMPWLNGEIKRLIAAKGMSGHFGSWSQPVDMVTTRAVVNLLVDAVDKKADFKDQATVQKYIEAEAGGPIKIRRYDPKGNQFLIVLPHVVY
ncbi:MAG TPA: DUF3798 domain-containing protein [Candidatus Eisenbacteria bacterium]|nr:DUF3798 domain-containing protein [Candidatus Eisenbacteria bacterium]